MKQLARIRPVAARFGPSVLAVVLAAGLLRGGPAAADAFDCGVAAPGDRPAVLATRLRLTVIPRLSHAWAAPRADARLEREIAAWFNRYSS